MLKATQLECPGLPGSSKSLPPGEAIVKIPLWEGNRKKRTDLAEIIGGKSTELIDGYVWETGMKEEFIQDDWSSYWAPTFWKHA